MNRYLYSLNPLVWGPLFLFIGLFIIFLIIIKHAWVLWLLIGWKLVTVGFQMGGGPLIFYRLFNRRY